MILKKLSLLRQLLFLLKNEDPIPAKYQSHTLQGNTKAVWSVIYRAIFF